MDLTPLFFRISQLRAAAARPILVSLDGRCGSGKTTLATRLAEHFPDSITVHTDDYYLPPAQRAAGWEQTPCANMDLLRLRFEVLDPARAGSSFSYRAWSCREGRYRPPVLCPPVPLLFVEGSYSQHPALTDCYDLRCFVTCSGAEQLRRLRAREGARCAAFETLWIPLEEGYFARYSIPENADLILDTEKGMIETRIK